MTAAIGRRRCALVVALLTLLPAQANATGCSFDSPKEPALSVTKSEGNIRFRYDLDQQGIARLAQAAGRAGAIPAGWYPVGLTVTELGTRMSVRVEAIQLAKEKYCVRLTNIDATLGYDKIDVYVARKYRQGSCPHNSITDHEMTHVAIFKEALDKYYPRVLRRFEVAASRLGPITARTPEAGAEYLHKRLKSELDPLLRQLNRETDVDNAKLDTPERYRQEQARCSDW